MTPYYDAACASLPANLANDVRALCPSASAETVLDSLIRFVVGADSPTDASPDARREWSQHQRTLEKALKALNPTSNDAKHARDEDGGNDDKDASSAQPNTKRPRKAENGLVPEDDDGGGELKFMWPALSATSPVRKKVNIAIHERSIRVVNATTELLEAVVPLSCIRRAFVLPSRGKTKPHWTVTVLPSDIPSTGKSASTSIPSHSQIVFDVEATASSLVNCQVGKIPFWQAKGVSIIHGLQGMLAHLPVPIIPLLPQCGDIFQIASQGSGSVSANKLSNEAASVGFRGVGAFRGAKGGTLWFLDEGILWDAKPCEFWAVEDLMEGDKALRLLSPTGRICSVILTRKGGEGEDGESGIESQFGMIEGREQDWIRKWVFLHRDLFGVAPATTSGSSSVPVSANGKRDFGATIPVNDDDDEDEDFMVESDESDGGSPTSGSSDEGDGDASDVGAEGSEVSDDGDEDEGGLHEKHHPLLRPGAMPRMSRAAIDAAVGIVEDSIRRVETDDEDELMD